MLKYRQLFEQLITTVCYKYENYRGFEPTNFKV